MGRKKQFIKVDISEVEKRIAILRVENPAWAESLEFFFSNDIDYNRILTTQIDYEKWLNKTFKIKKDK